MKKVILFIILSSFLATGFGVLAKDSMTLPDPGLTPDSSFYFLKSWKEGIQTFFSFGDENKARRFLHLSEVRLAEYQKMVEKGKTEVAEKTLEKYQEQLERALNKTSDIKAAGGKVEEISIQIFENNLRHMEVLSGVYVKVPEEAKEAIKNVIEKSVIRGFEEVSEFLPQEKQKELRAKIEEKREQIEEKLDFLKPTLPTTPLRAVPLQEEKRRPTTQENIQPSKVGTSLPIAANPKELLGWWEEVESWSLDSSTGQLKKNSQAFPFQREFTDKYFCTQYSAKFTCANNVIYSVSGNKISVEGLLGFYEWRIVDGLLELTSKGSKGPAFAKSLSKNIGSPTSTGKITAPAVTREGMAENPKPSLKFVKVGESGICLKHEGGDSFSVMDIHFKIDGGNTLGFLSLQQFPTLIDYIFDRGESLQQFPTLIDYIFDRGEYFVFAIGSPVFKAGSRVEVVVKGETVAGPWTVEKVLRESGPVLIGGLATCP